MSKIWRETHPASFFSDGALLRIFCILIICSNHVGIACRDCLLCIKPSCQKHDQRSRKNYKRQFYQKEDVAQINKYTRRKRRSHSSYDCISICDQQISAYKDLIHYSKHLHLKTAVIAKLTRMPLTIIIQVLNRSNPAKKRGSASVAIRRDVWINKLMTVPVA